MPHPTRYFVTGGSRGIGAAIVWRAASRGSDVAFTYVRDEASATDLASAVRKEFPKVRCAYYQLDVTDSAAVERVCDQALDLLGGLDVVVPNAGINRNALAISMTDEDWHDVINTNLSGAFFVARQVIPTMMDQRFGRIIFISSLSRNGLTGQANYAASKAGLLGLAKTLAREYGPKGITTNVLAPGFVSTDMTEEHMSGLHGEFWTRYCPVKRLATPSEVAAAVEYLASADASFTNGSCLPLTGGLDWAP